MRPVSISACAFFRLAALITPSVSVSVERIFPGIDQARDLGQDFVLLFHVLGLEQRAGKHQLPMDGHGLALERHHIQHFRIVDQPESPLRRDQLDDVFQMIRGVGG